MRTLRPHKELLWLPQNVWQDHSRHWVRYTWPSLDHATCVVGTEAHIDDVEGEEDDETRDPRETFVLDPKDPGAE